MVLRDMVRRLRPVLAVLAALAMLSLVALVATPATDAPASTMSASSASSDQHATVTKSTSARVGTLQRLPSLPFGVVVALLALAVIAASPVLDRRRTGLQRHRIDDVGDRWRSLLLGAPPALA